MQRYIPREQAEREARLAEETEPLKHRYGTSDDQRRWPDHVTDADAELADHRQGDEGAADALLEVAADDARRRAEVRSRCVWRMACRWWPRASTA